MKINSYACGLVIFTILICSGPSWADEDDQGLDTTRVRKTVPVKKSTGEIIADIPGEILKLPFYTLEFVTHTIALNPPVSWATQLIDLGAEAKPYLPVAGYSSRAGLKLGFSLRKLKNIVSTDYIRASWYYSTNDYQSYTVATHKAKRFTEKLGFDLYFRYKKFPRERFFGLGMDSREDKKATYTLENTEFKIEFPFHPYKRSHLNLIGGYSITNLSDGRDPSYEGDLDAIFADPDFGLSPGHLDASRYAFFGLSFEWDNRNDIGQPSRGTHAYTSYLKYSGVNRSDGLDFSKYTIDLRHYQNIWRKRILAVRFYLQRFDADDANVRATPIYFKSTLGGPESMRGFSSGRYIDNDLAMVSAEYRYPVYEVIDAFVFLDEGRVYEKVSSEDFFEGWRSSMGFGLRVWNTIAPVATFQIAWSEEETLFYFQMGAAW